MILICGNRRNGDNLNSSSQYIRVSNSFKDKIKQRAYFKHCKAVLPKISFQSSEDEFFHVNKTMKKREKKRLGPVVYFKSSRNNF